MKTLLFQRFLAYGIVNEMLFFLLPNEEFHAK